MAVMTSSSCLSVLFAVLTYLVVISAFPPPSADDAAAAIQLRNNIAPAYKNLRAYRLLELEARRQLRNGKYMRFGRASHDDDAWGRSGTDSDLNASQFDDFTEPENDVTRAHANSDNIQNKNEKTSLTEKQNHQQQLRFSDDRDHQNVAKVASTLSEDVDALQLKRSRLTNEPGSQFMRFGR